MANAIKQISVQRGHDVTDYTLTSFGGAGGQHACLVADALGMTDGVHPPAGRRAVGLRHGPGRPERDARAGRRSAPRRCGAAGAGRAPRRAGRSCARASCCAQGVAPARIALVRARAPALRRHRFGAGRAVRCGWRRCRRSSKRPTRKRYSFLMPARALIVEAVSVEAIGAVRCAAGSRRRPAARARCALQRRRRRCACTARGAWHDTGLYRARGAAARRHACAGPAIIAEANATTVVEPGWQARGDAASTIWCCTRVEALPERRAIGTTADPVMLEIFNNLFMSIAEQMGLRLQNTAYSVNIKERLDFSCAIFDARRQPDRQRAAHAGAPGLDGREHQDRDARERRPHARRATSIMLNDPYNGGTHLPDVTVITPVFDEAGASILFYVGSRGHHADIGGITPGSMPPDSSAHRGGGRADRQLQAGRRQRRRAARGGNAAPCWPARATRRAIPDQNLADLRAQVAANQKGVEELHKMVAHFGLDVVQAYMGHVQDNAEEAVRRVITALKDGSFALRAGQRRAASRSRSGSTRRRAAPSIDFTGTSAPAAEQLQCAVGRLHGGGAVRVPHAGRRRDSAERRLPEAAEGDHPARLDAQSALSGRRSCRATSRPRPASPTRCTARWA